MTDKERRDYIFHVCQDARIALMSEQRKLNNAMFEYLQAINRYHETVEEYLDNIQKALNEND